MIMGLIDSNSQVSGIVEKVQQAGSLLSAYNSLRSKQNDDQFETVYPNHLRDFQPVFDINSGILPFIHLYMQNR